MKNKIRKTELLFKLGDLPQTYEYEYRRPQVHYNVSLCVRRLFPIQSNMGTGTGNRNAQHGGNLASQLIRLSYLVVVDVMAYPPDSGTAVK